MSNLYDDKEQLERLEKVHLRGADENLAPGERIEFLKKRIRKKNWLIGLNVLAILFFSYSFYYGITQLGETLFTILVVVFVINVGLVLLQKRQIAEMIEVYRRG
ncbi:MAG: hypothetical protein WD355_04985 [Balneolaceae bacterium]